METLLNRPPKSEAGISCKEASMKIILIIAMSFLCFELSGQQYGHDYPNYGHVIDSGNHHYTIALYQPRLGIAFQKSLAAEIGIQRKIESYSAVFGYMSNAYLSTDIFFLKELLVSPKLGYEFHIESIGVGGDINWFTNFRQNMATISPRISFWKRDWFQLTYSYNFPLSSHRFEQIMNHRFTILTDIKFRRKK